MNRVCTKCDKQVEDWNKKCGGCGFALELVPDEERKMRYLRRPALGALLFTQGWALGARIYFWFLLSLVPILGIVALIVCVLFGRRFSWKYGGWDSWQVFQERMRLMDIVGGIWILILLGVYFFTK